MNARARFPSVRLWTPRILARAAALGLLLSAAAASGREVNPYEVTVVVPSGGDVATPALRLALVRATGRRDALTDPALAPLFARAGELVRATRPGKSDRTQVSLDGAALDQAIAESGVGLWSRQRPLTLIVLPGGAPAGARAQLESAAVARGLPVNVMDPAAFGASGVPTDRAAALAAARRFGADALLVGRPAADGTSLGWQLVHASTSESFGGAPDAAIDSAADAFVRVDATQRSQPELRMLVEVTGLARLRDYGRATALVEKTPGIKRAQLVSLKGGAARFLLTARGAADTILQALTASGSLQRGSEESGSTVYVYRP